MNLLHILLLKKDTNKKWKKKKNNKEDFGKSLIFLKNNDIMII